MWFVIFHIIALCKRRSRIGKHYPRCIFLEQLLRFLVKFCTFVLIQGFAGFCDQGRELITLIESDILRRHFCVSLTQVWIEEVIRICHNASPAIHSHRMLRSEEHTSELQSRE